MQHYNDLGEGLKKTTTIDNIRKNIDEKRRNIYRLRGER